MKREGRVRAILCWLILLLSLAMLFGGCTKQRAQMALNKARKLQTEAERQEAEKYKPDLLEQTRKAIDETNSLMAQRQYALALERAKRAVEVGKQTVEEAKIMRAADKLNQAKRALDVARTNEGSKEDPERYEKIVGLYDMAEAKRNKNKWDDAIDLSDRVMREVEILLQRLKNLAERKLLDAQNALKSLRAEGAETYSPESIIEVTDLVNTVEKLIKENQDYLSAQAQADHAIRKADEGITKTKGKKSEEKIKKIESDLALAITKNAEIYARDMLEKALSTFDSVIKDYYAKNFDRVLMSTPLLEHDVLALLETTKQRAAEARIKAVEQTIKELVDGGAREFLIGRVEILEEKLKAAREKFELKEYEEAETVCLLAMDEGERIRSDFNDLALDAIRTASEALNISQNLFEQMEQIFIIKPLPTMLPLEREFENSKETLKSELGTRIQNARLTLGIAQLRQEGGEYKRAIELAGEVRKSAEYILGEIYHVVAHNAIMELALKISEYERDGGREYAPAELEQTKRLLEEAKLILKAGRYKEVVSKAAETRAQMEVMAQTIEKTAVEQIKMAKEGLAEALKVGAQKYKQPELAKTEELLKEAEARLQAQELKPAVEKAFAAASLIKTALSEAAKLWAVDELSLSGEKILRAEEAGAREYAPALLDEARRLQEAAKRLLAEENFLESKAMAEKAGNKAQEALFKRVQTAEDLITEAKAYGGWEREFELLSTAIEEARRSRRLIEERDYTSSRLYAEKAIKDAQEVLTAAKIGSHKEQARQIRNTLQEATLRGANYFQPEEVKTLLASLGKIESEFTVENFDFCRKELERIEAELNRLIARIPEVLENIIKAELGRLEDITEAYDRLQPGKSQEIRQMLKFAQIDYKAGKNLSAYQRLKQARELISRMETVLAEDRYLKEVEGVLDELDGIMKEFSSVLSIGPEVVLKLATDPQGKSRMLALANELSPTEFREKLNTLYEKAGKMEPPPTKKTLHEEVLELLNTATLAGIDFEKLTILEEYSPKEVVHMVNRAFSLVSAVKKKEEEIRQYLTQQEKKYRTAAAEASL